MSDAHNDRIVAQFTRWARPFADLPLHAEADAMAQLLDAADLAPGQRVLDVACGPGIVACEAARRGPRVTGIDLTPAMVAEARARQDRLGLAGLDWHTGDVTALPFPDASFDRVLTRYSFHHLQAPAAALAEMRRVCRPGGRIVVCDATPEPETQAAYDRMETLRDPSHTSALTRNQLRGLGQALGLEEVRVDGHRLEAGLHGLADPESLPALEAMFDADIAGGRDRIGVAARRTPDGIRFTFPITIVAWRRAA